MERIGDQASDIAEITIRLIKEGSSYQVENIPKMAATAMSMVKQSVTAFVETDTALAQEIIRRDDQVDALFDKVKPVSYTHLCQSQSLVPYHLATSQYQCCAKPRHTVKNGVGNGNRTHDPQDHNLMLLSLIHI